MLLKTREKYFLVKKWLVFRVKWVATGKARNHGEMIIRGARRRVMAYNESETGQVV